MDRIRNQRIDFIKGIGIILIVLGNTQMGLCGFVNLFHVGLFFIAAGVCFNETYTSSLSDLKIYIIKRIKRLYVPFILWNIGFLCFRSLFCVLGIIDGNIITYEEFGVQFFQILIMKSGELLVGPCWFIRALFILQVLFAVIDFLGKKILKNNNIYLRWDLTIVFLIIGNVLRNNNINTDNIGTIMSCWILFTSGIELKKLLTCEDKLKTLKKYDLLSALLGLAVLCVVYMFGTVSYDSNNYTNIFVFLFGAAGGWIFVWGVSGIAERRLQKVNKFIVFAGGRTMEILFLHLLCFKIVSFILVLTETYDRSQLSMFPVISNEWWVYYFIVGVFVPLIIGKLSRLIISNKKLVRYCIVYMAVLGAGILPQIAAVYISDNINFINTEENSLSEDLKIDEISEEKFSLVYDYNYYLEKNPDVKEIIGSDKEKVFRHFYENGMKEGRMASENFDVYYYKENNPDLAEKYKDNMQNYYYHYIIYGHSENRNASTINLSSVKYPLEALCKLSDKEKINAEIIINDESFNENTVYLLESEAYNYNVDEAILVQTIDISKDKNLSFKLSDINHKYILAVKKDDKYEAVSNYTYVVNPEILDENVVKRTVPKTKKGLQIMNSLLDDVKYLDTSYAFMNLSLEKIMAPDKNSQETIVYNYKGREYYFKKDEIQNYDREISELTRNGIVVTASVVSHKQDGYEELYYPDINMDTGAAFYALNTTDKSGLNYVEAFVSFMSERYDGTNNNCGSILNWVVGNEVNDSKVYNYMGEKRLDDYLKEYTRTFRIIYNIVKSNNASANIYVPMEPWWGISSNMLIYGGKEFLKGFADTMKINGDIDWGLAYHAYSFPLNDPKVLNDTERTIDITGDLTPDGYFATDSENCITITMKNIDVLTNYMHKNEMLNSNGEVRNIILSEQGYTANSNLYGKCEALQAASMVYAYYKTEMNPDIDAFIYFLQMDTEAASLSNEYYKFGLLYTDENNKKTERLSHSVFKIMDKKESLSELEYIKNILGIDNWNEVIPDFNKDIFNKFASVDNSYNVDKSKKISLKNAEIKVEDQKYTGSECLPDVEVVLNGKILKNDIDYDATYINNVEPGKATVVITGLNNYIDISEAQFNIND